MQARPIAFALLGALLFPSLLVVADTITDNGDGTADYLEDFEDFPAGTFPAQEWYTRSNVGGLSSSTSTAQANSGTVSLVVDPSNTPATVEFVVPSMDPCNGDGDGFDFQLYGTELNLLSERTVGFTVANDNNAANDGVFLRMVDDAIFGNDPMIMTAELILGGTVLDSHEFNSVPYGQWQAITVRLSCAPNYSATVTIGGQSTVLDSGGSTTTLKFDAFTFGSLDTANQDGDPFYIDDFKVVGASAPAPDDVDGDGVPDATDNCPNDANPSQGDQDNDGQGDACDDFPQFPGNPDTAGFSSFEDFEDDEPGAFPMESWYSLNVEDQGVDAFEVSTEQAEFGSQSLKTTAAVDSPDGRFTVLSGLVNAVTVSLWRDCAGAAAHTAVVAIYGENGLLGAFNVAGDCAVEVYDGGAQIGVGAVAAGWNRYEIVLDFDAQSIEYSINAGVVAGDAVFSSAANQAATFGLGNGFAGEAAPVYWDNVAVSGGVGATASEVLTLNEVTGFDIDDTGQTGIVRYDGGKVTTFAATTLTLSGTVDDTECNGPGPEDAVRDNVAALASHVTYLACDNGAVDRLKIKSSSMGAPGFGSTCTQGSFCYATIETSELDGDQGKNVELDDVHSYPFDFSVGRTSGENAVHMAWAWSDVEGDIGVFTQTFRNNAPDRSDIEGRNVGPVQIDQLAACHSGADGFDYLYGASQASTVKGYRVHFKEQSGFASGGHKLFVDDLEVVLTGDSRLTAPNAVACGNDHLMISLDSGKIVLAERTGNAHALTTLLENNPGDTPKRGVAITTNGAYGAFVNGSLIHVVDLESRELVDLHVLPGGSFLGMRMDGSGQGLWVATSSQVAYYNIQERTGAEPFNEDEFFDGVPTGPGAGNGTDGGYFAGQAQVIGESFGAGAGLGNLFIFGFFASFFVGMMAVPTFVASRSVKLTMFAAAAAIMLAFIIGAVMGFVETWVVTLVAFVSIAIAVVGVFFKGR